MKLGWIIGLVFLHQNLFSQARLGYTASDIKKEFSDKSHELVSEYDSDKDYYIRVWTDIATVYFYFDEDFVCNLVYIIPDDNGKLNYYVEDYNKSFVIINNKEWNMYNESGIANIKLIYPEKKGDKPYFVWIPND